MNQLLAALINGGIAGAALTVAVCLALSIAPRRALNAATRYAIWWTTLLVVIVLPAFYLPPRAEPVAAIQPIATSVSVEMPVTAASSRPAATSGAVLAALAFPRWPVVMRARTITASPQAAMIHQPGRVAAANPDCSGPCRFAVSSAPVTATPSTWPT